MAEPTKYDKAMFTNVDEKKDFQVQFNPKEFKLDEGVTWKDSEEFLHKKPLLTFDRGKPSIVSMDLIFDTTDTGQCVELMFVREMRSLLSVTVEKKGPGDKEIKRPPFVLFKWKDFEFECVCEKVSVVYLMFKSDGTPLRAKVTVSLKERRSDLIHTLWTNVDPISAMASMLAGQKGEVRGDSDAIGPQGGEGSHSSSLTTAGEVKGGETANQIAHKYGQEDFRPIAAANGWDDPMDPPPGAIVIPAGIVAAGIFAHLNKSEAPSEWGDITADLHPDSDNSDAWDVEMGEYEHGLSEASMEFNSVDSEHSYGAENEASFSDAYGGDVEANEYTQGESDQVQEFSEGVDVDQTAGEENEASFSDAYSGDVEANEYEQGASEGMQEVSEGVEVDHTSGEVQGFSDGVDVDHSSADENEASFSAEYGGDVEANAYEQGASDGPQEFSEGVDVDHSAGAENEASFSDAKSGDVTANEISHDNAQADEVAGAAAETGKSASSSDSGAGGADGGKGDHSSDNSAGGASTGSGDHSSDNSAAGAVASSSAEKGGETAGSDGKSGSDAAGEVAGGAANKGNDAAADVASSSAGKAESTNDTDPKVGAAAESGGKSGAPSTGGLSAGAGGNKAAGAVAGDAAQSGAVDSGPPPQTLAPSSSDRSTADQVNSGIGNASLGASKLDDAIDEIASGPGDIKSTIENVKARGDMLADDFKDPNS